ncbi:hypothetical protein ACIBXA_28375 [Micromonospora echinaurantiaca]|uniref:hypothetical protein n=1 Tax=Micromonospora TaxID=1873 RepID=UPI000D6F1CBA|nr:hypothetical protein [Micromonospora sp. S4605]PWU56799.1 hypothetical protein DLJ47_04840 [Micromonospora sp. S4605]
MVVIGSVVALATLIAAAYRLSADPQVEHGKVVILAVLAPGALLVLSWLVRLLQWWGAARAPARPVMVTAHLAQSPQPGSAGRVTGAAHAVSAAGGIDTSPKGYAVWLTVSGRDGGVLHQRVVWEPWLRELARPRQAMVRHGFGVSVVDVTGYGRLWPASFTLRRRPYGVRLIPFRKARRLPKENSLSHGRLAYLFILLLMPCLGGAAAQGAWALLGWWVAYVVASMTATGAWFGIIPPGVLSRAARRGRAPAAS